MSAEEVRDALGPSVVPVGKPDEWTEGKKVIARATHQIKGFELLSWKFNVTLGFADDGLRIVSLNAADNDTRGRYHDVAFSKLEDALTEKYGPPIIKKNNAAREHRETKWQSGDTMIELSLMGFGVLEKDYLTLTYSRPSKEQSKL